MSRKWKRMVERNYDQVSKQRSKQESALPGVKLLSDGTEMIRGRSIVMPITMIAIVSMFILVYGSSAGNDPLFWVTVGAYVFLALVYFLRRPYLRIGRSFLSTRRMGRDQIVEAKDIASITCGDGYVAIDFKSKRRKWFFSRVMNRYPTDRMAERLLLFAQRTGVPMYGETTDKS
ncbi:methyltransferase [Xylanibacillus composti]|uniref:Uncharacterized protein n=1 Tax=Xylanibacillus composti TaxID=1572762 RepID=A0A8J4H4X1_9BACL|nr:methyltransferase [Xylanibacillus composti]MDT9724252.1 methyltransferase [Xylanibacillus composti]GIQ69567.1 hypothetical protein XYCOK13_23910 [Xylanibacillus composti]